MESNLILRRWHLVEKLGPGFGFSELGAVVE